MHLFDILQYSIFYFLFKISVRAERSRSWRKREQKTAMFYYFNKFEYHSPNIEQQCSYSARKKSFFYYEKSETFFLKKEEQPKPPSKQTSKKKCFFNCDELVLKLHLWCIHSNNVLFLFLRKSYLERGKI